MRTYSPRDIDALTNWDGLLCKPPFRNEREQRQYYARFIERMLWRYFSSNDWNVISKIIDDLRVSPKLKRTTTFLLSRHISPLPKLLLDQ